MQHTLTRTFITTLVLGALAAPAVAQPSAAPELQATADQPDPDVSTLNGQLVPVGEHNRYRYSFKKYNVSTNPIGMIMGSYGVSAQYAFNKRIALRGDINYYAPVDSDTQGFELGFGAPVYFRKMYSGLFVEPGVVIRQLTSDRGGSATTIGPQTLVGWHWYWDSGLNLAVAFGVGRNINARKSNDDYVDAEEELFPNGYVRFGYAF